MLHGSCACGATEYEVEDAFSYAMNCHCSKCRAATGSAYKPMGGIEREKLRVTREDTPMFVWGEPDAGDFRCGVCGSFLYSVTGSGSMSRSARSSTHHHCSPTITSSLAPKRRGTRSATGFRSSSNTQRNSPPLSPSRSTRVARGSLAQAVCTKELTVPLEAHCRRCRLPRVSTGE